MATIIECLPSGVIRPQDQIIKHSLPLSECEAWLARRGYQRVKDGGDVWAIDYHGEWQRPFKVLDA